MRDYAKIAPTFWTGKTGKALKARGSEAVVVGMYLLSSPHSNMLGLFYQPVLYMAHETGLGLEGAKKGLQGAIEAGFCAFDEASEMVWVFEMASYQVASELKATDNRCAGIQKDYDALQDNPFLGDFFDKYAPAFHLTRKRESGVENKAPSIAPIKPLLSQEQEKEKEKDIPPTPKGGCKRFEEFWTAWPKGDRKQDKVKCAEKWRRGDFDSVADLILADIGTKRGTDKWREGYIEAPLVYLNGKRWEDGVEAGEVQQESFV